MDSSAIALHGLKLEADQKQAERSVRRASEQLSVARGRLTDNEAIYRKTIREVTDRFKDVRSEASLRLTERDVGRVRTSLDQLKNLRSQSQALRQIVATSTTELNQRLAALAKFSAKQAALSERARIQHLRHLEKQKNADDEEHAALFSVHSVHNTDVAVDAIDSSRMSIPTTDTEIMSVATVNGLAPARSPVEVVHASESPVAASDHHQVVFNDISIHKVGSDAVEIRLQGVDHRFNFTVSPDPISTGVLLDVRTEGRALGSDSRRMLEDNLRKRLRSVGISASMQRGRAR